MARTNKTISSTESDDHLARLAKLRKDSEKQLTHINRVRVRKGLPPIERITLGTQDDQIVTRDIDEKEDQELVGDSDLIVGLRVYRRSPGGPVGKSVEGEKLCSTHRDVRRLRECYREFDGTMVHVGEVTGMRKLKAEDGEVEPGEMVKRRERKAPGVLKSIMVRLVPHEAEAVVGAELNRKAIASAMDRTVAALERETGVEIISAVAHRMSSTDLHLHIQYTLIHQVVESKSMLGRRHRPWRQQASAMARESLIRDGVLNPASAAIGKRKSELALAGLLEPEPQAGIEFHKRKGLRSLGDGAIFGYSFRQKLNLVRLAEDGGEPEVAAAVTKKNDERGRFAPHAKKSDELLDREFLDLWLERIWRQNVKEELSEESRNGLVAAGVAAARNYATFGTTLVEETHIARRIEELFEETKALEASSLAAKTEETHIKLQMAELEESAKRAEVAALRQVAAMEEQVAMLRKCAEAAEKSAEDARLAEAAALWQVEAMKEQVAEFGNSAEVAEKSANSAKIAETAAQQELEVMKEQMVEFGNSAEAAKKSAESAKRAEATALQQVRTMEKQVDDFIKSADEEAKQSVDAAKRAEVAAELRATALAEKVEQLAKSANDSADIQKLIQAILDEPVVRALLETITELWQKIVELAARVGFHLGGPEVKEPVKPPKVEGMEME